jgi:D-threo-aldose 1-dehydrogenase
MQSNRIGNTGVEVTALGFGTSSLDSIPGTYGYEVSEDRAQATLTAIFNSPVTLLDTSRNYALGESEARIGRAFAARGGHWSKALRRSGLTRCRSCICTTRNMCRT